MGKGFQCCLQAGKVLTDEGGERGRVNFEVPSLAGSIVCVQKCRNNKGKANKSPSSNWQELTGHIPTRQLATREPVNQTWKEAQGYILL